MNNTHRNIENIQKEVKNSISNLLLGNGYSLVKEEKFKDNLDFALLWFNKERNHTIYLNWDIRDNEFVLKEYDKISDLKYSYSSEIDLFPFNSFFVFFRKRYNVKYCLKIESKIQERLNRINIRTSRSQN